MRPNAKPRIHGTTRKEPLTLLSKAPDRSGWRGAPGRTKEPIVRAQQAGACTIVAVTGRMPIIACTTGTIASPHNRQIAVRSPTC